MGADTKGKKNKHFKKSRKTISFEEEIVTRDEASKYLREDKANPDHSLDNTNDDVNRKPNKKKRQKTGESELGSDAKKDKKTKKEKRKKSKEPSINAEESTVITDIEQPKKGKKRNEPSTNAEESTVISENEQPKKGKKRKNKTLVEEFGTVDESVASQPAYEESHSPEKRQKCEDGALPGSTDIQAENAANPEPQKSKRLQKREKHQKLLDEKKLKSELHLQQKALEYLSKWKHSRNTWRFEKLKQIWLQQNLFESSKIPPEFWDSVLEYFTSARGKVKSILIEKAIKIIEENKTDEPQDDAEDHNSDEVTEPEESENNHVANKVKRARDIVQYLQEE